METILFNYTFVKPIYRQSDFLELFSLSLPTLKRYIQEYRDNGGDVADMGRLEIQGYREICWNPQKFLLWLLENKVVIDVRYDYEALEQTKVKKTLSNLSEIETNIKPFMKREKVKTQ